MEARSASRASSSVRRCDRDWMTRSSAGEMPACSASCSGDSAHTAGGAAAASLAAAGLASSAQARAPSNRPGAAPTARTATTPPMATATSGKRRGVFMDALGSGGEKVLVERTTSAVEALLRSLVSGQRPYDGGDVVATGRARRGGQAVDAFGQGGHAAGAIVLFGSGAGRLWGDRSR